MSISCPCSENCFNLFHVSCGIRKLGSKSNGLCVASSARFTGFWCQPSLFGCLANISLTLPGFVGAVGPNHPDGVNSFTSGQHVHLSWSLCAASCALA